MFLAKGLTSCTKEEKLGEGSYGKVYKAKQTRFKGKVAIKVTSKKETDANENKSVERNLDKCLKSLKHCNIVEYYGAIEMEKKFYVYMEYIEGNSLSKTLKDHGPIFYEKICSYSKQILKGLEYLHGNSVIHRDINPSNILVTSNDRIKLCDFGLSRILVTLVGESEDVNANMSSLESSNLMNVSHSSTMGTWNYQAPEVQIEGKSYFVSDIWSFGVTMMEMWTGRMVSESIPGWNKMVTNKMKINLEPLKLISMEMKNVLVKAFHLDPVQRSSSTDLLQCDMFRLNY